MKETLFWFWNGYPLDGSRAVFLEQNRPPKFAGVLVNAVPKFIGSHFIHSRSPFGGFHALERFGQTLPAQYRPECDFLKTGMLCAVFSMSITAVAPSQSPLAIPRLPLVGRVPYVFCALRLCVNGTVLL